MGRTGADAIVVGNTVKVHRANLSGTSSRPSFFFCEICASHTAPLSVAATKAELVVLVPLDADPRLGEEAHDLTDQMLLTKYYVWHGQVRSASLQKHPHAATRTQRLQKISIRGGRGTLCSTETSSPFSLPSGPRAATSCGFAHRSAQQFSGILSKISCPT